MMVTIKDIVEGGFCSGCGLCISESKDSKMIWDKNGFLIPDISKTFNSKAIKVCPYNPSPDVEVRDEDKLADIFLNTSNFKDDKIGNYIATYAGYSKAYRMTSSSGGLATYIFEQLLKRGIVNHLFVVKEVDGAYGYQWFDNISDITQISKTRYFPVTLEKLFLEIDSKEGRVAVSGVDSFIKAIRLKQFYYPEYKSKIPFLVGIICGGLKSRFFTDYLAQKAGIGGVYKNAEYRIKDLNSHALDYSFGAFDSNGLFHNIKMSKVGDMWGTALFNSLSYDLNSDVTAELADISLGDAWIDPYKKDPKGTNIIITRSGIADDLICEGRYNSELIIDNIGVSEILKSQAGGFNHKQKSLYYRFQHANRKLKNFPYLRTRIFENIDFGFRIVQRRRIKMRALSLKIWRKFPISSVFDEKMNWSMFKLKVETRIYHELRKYKSKI